MPNDYTVSDYLLDRMAELGIRHLFGVPVISPCSCWIM